MERYDKQFDLKEDYTITPLDELPIGTEV